MEPVALAALLIPLGLSLLPPGNRLYQQGLPGLGFLGGWAAAMLALFVAGIAGVPLHLAAWLLALLAAAGLVAGLRKWRSAPDCIRSAVTHPLTLLSVAVLAMICARSPVVYEIYAWDTWTNWAGWARQMVVTDSVYRPDMWIATRGDTPGWPLAMALPGLIGGRFSAETAWAAAIFLHIGLLALFFDIARLVFRRGAAAGLVNASLLAWVFVLAALGIELSWSLFPTLLLVEEPQYYFLAAGFLTVVAGAYLEDRSTALVVAAALMMVAAYLVKMSLVAFVPAFLIAAAFWLWRGGARPDRTAVAGIGAIVAALVGIVLIWKIAAPPGRCQADMASMVARLMSNEPVHGTPFAAFAADVGARALDFALAWKFPVTLAALAGIAVFARRRAFWAILAALSALWVLFYAGMVTGMASCFSATEIENLASVQRYTRVPLRLTQTVGVFLLLIAAASAAAPLIRRVDGRPGTRRVVTVSACLAIAVLAAWQVRQGWSSIDLVRTRTNIDAAFQRSVHATKADVAALAPDGRAAPVQVLYLTVPPFVERVAANYHGLGSARGEPLRRVVASSYRIDAGPDSADGLRAEVRRMDAVVIAGAPGAAARAVPEIRAALSGCTPGADGYVLVRRAGGRALVCRPRGGP